MLKLILTLGIASLAVACANTDYMSSRSDGSNPSTMGAPPSPMDSLYGNTREPANF